ncbi:MAG: undecaprenyldiphospho-muramoylpentapeptide beta-N-acetylglucosaminyltransferase [Pseudomarimonas sp.]
MSAAVNDSMLQAPVLIMAGGTGGHIFPGLAVAAALRARNVPVTWLGSQRGLETRLVPGAGITLSTIAVSGLRGRGWLTLLAAPLTILRALLQAIAVLRAIKPRAAISFGGYAAGPGGLAAWLLRCPLLVHEQNRIPGLTNRVLARIAKRVLLGFPDAMAGAQWVGNPVRNQIAQLPSPSSRLAGRSGPLCVLVMGGSQGARALNAAVPAALSGLNGFTIRHQCGERLADSARSAYAQANVEVRLEPFIERMDEAYGWADLVICRSGALTVAELAAAGVAALLVPFPHAVDDHQTHNAQWLVDAGAAERIAEGPDLAMQLKQRLLALASDRPTLLRMAEAARACAKTDAAEQVALACLAEARA